MSDPLSNTKYLKNIHSPNDVKALSRTELKNLCGEIRYMLVETVAETRDSTEPMTPPTPLTSH